MDNEELAKKLLSGEIVKNRNGTFYFDRPGNYAYIDRDGNNHLTEEYLHRTDGPAIEYTDGSTGWYQHGKLHREDGPAIIMKGGTHLWYQHGKLHREDGPAQDWVDGHREWHIHGIKLTEEEFNNRT